MGLTDTDKRLDRIEATLEQLLTLFKGAPAVKPSALLAVQQEDKELLEAYRNLPIDEYRKLHKRVMKERCQRKR